MNKSLTQQQVWDRIARPWKKFRAKPIEEVIDFLKKQRGRILDLGCGSGRHFVKSDGLIYGIDFSEKMIKLSKKYAEKSEINAIIKKASVTKLPFQDNFFDSAIFIASLHNLETAEKRKKSLKELKRVLKKGSEALISVWNKNQPRFKNKQKEVFIGWKIKDKSYKRYYYLYDKKELLDLLKKVGFEILKIWENENIFVRVKK